MKPRIYVDSSAYLGVLTRSSSARDIASDFDRAVLMSSVMFVLEVQRSLVRLAREKALTTEQYVAAVDQFRADLDGFVLRDATLDLCLPTTMPAASLPRSLDLLHLRTALWFHAEAPLTRFVSLDRTQNQAARELGLPV